MLEVLISKNDLKPIVVKTKPAIWSANEHDKFYIKNLDDADLEPSIDGNKSYPYAVYEAETMVILETSVYTVKPASLNKDTLVMGVDFDTIEEVN